MIHQAVIGGRWSACGIAAGALLLALCLATPQALAAEEVTPAVLAERMDGEHKQIRTEMEANRKEAQAERNQIRAEAQAERNQIRAEAQAERNQIRTEMEAHRLEAKGERKALQAEIQGVQRMQDFILWALALIGAAVIAMAVQLFIMQKRLTVVEQQTLQQAEKLADLHRDVKAILAALPMHQVYQAQQGKGAEGGGEPKAKG